jgi:hypothetical protein
MIVKIPEDKDPVVDLHKTFQQLRRYDLRLNPNKCTFGVEAGKFLGFMLTSRGIEVNPDKCSDVLNMQSPRTIKEVQQLIGRIAALTRFLPDSAIKCLPFFRTLRRKEEFQWNRECEEAFQELKKILSAPPVLSHPDPEQTLYLYLAVTNEAISAALVKEESWNQSPI